MRGATPEQRRVLGLCPLWIAKYGPPPKDLPASWGAWVTWFMWQYTSTANNGPDDQETYPRAMQGFNRENQDRSCFRGTLEEFEVQWKRAGIPL